MSISSGRPPAHPGAAGVAVAVVTNNEDPDSRGRVRLRFPWLPEEHETGWVRVVAPYAGPGRGLCFVPEVDDEVLVAFERSDIDRPIVIGSLWGGRSPLPCDPAPGNSTKCIRTRSGFRLEWEEGDDVESFTIADPDGKLCIVLDARRHELRITAEKGDIRIASPDGTIRLECRELEVECSGGIRARAAATIEVSSDTAVSVDSSGDLTANAGARAAISGRSLDLRGAAAVGLRGQKVEVRASALLEQRAPIIKIN